MPRHRIGLTSDEGFDWTKSKLRGMTRSFTDDVVHHWEVLRRDPLVYSRRHVETIEVGCLCGHPHEETSALVQRALKAAFGENEHPT